MAVCKLSKSGKQLQFIDDDGNVYGTSVSYAIRLLNGELKGRGQFVLLTRMPIRIAKNRFKESPVYDPTGELAKIAKEQGVTLSTEEDGFSAKTRKRVQQREQFEDKVVDW